MPKVALIMGSKSDWPSLRGCVDVLKGFEIEVEVHVASAHRTPETVAAFAANARENGFEAIIAQRGEKLGTLRQDYDSCKNSLMERVGEYEYEL